MSSSLEARKRRLASARQKLGGSKTSLSVVRQERRDRFPLSSSQRRLWFLEQAVPGSLVFQVPAVVRVNGALDVDALTRAITRLVERHAVLRAHIEQQGPEAVCVVAEKSDTSPSVELVDATGAEKADGLETANQFIRTPFDLRSGPLFRVQVLKLGNDNWILSFLLHHIICEAWSISIIFEELEKLYREELGGEDACLPTPEIHFGDYAAWERESSKSDDVLRSVRYWTDHLDDVPVVELPTDRPRPPIQTQNGAIVGHTMRAADVAAVSEFAADQDATPFLVTLTALYTLINRWTGEETIALGCPVSSRDKEELQRVIGFFVNTLVMKAHVVPDATTASLLASVRNTVLDAYSNQSAPFELIVDQLNLPRDLSRNPIFQIMFAFQNTPQPNLTLDGVQSAEVLPPSEVHSKTSKTDISVIIEPIADEWVVWAEYNTDLFDESTVLNFLEHYHSLLMRMVQAPDAKLATLDYIPPGILKTMLEDWNDTALTPDESTIVQRIAQSVQDYPEHTAVTGPGGKITYSELASSSDALAHLLVAEGIERGDTVCVFLPRSAEVVVSELAVLKCGATYVPVDPSYPDDRVNFMVQDSGAKVVITDSGLAGRLDNCRHITPSLEALLDNDSAARFDPVISAPDELAYVSYTSGSTGKPKGVQISHRAFQNFVDWQSNCYELGPNDVFAMLASTAFDGSVWEIWPSLSRGSAITVVDDETRVMADKLVQWLADESVTVCYLPTLLCEAALAEEWPSHHTMKALLTGGEALHPVKQSSLPCRLYNHYGPTENTVISTVCEVDTESVAMPSIGRPIRNVEAYILDERLQPVPPGAIGELCLSGLSVGDGYRNRDDLTQEVFVKNSISSSRYERMYRSGDLCRYDADGNIHFLGRRDRQVKIRGFRIELGEIESALLENPSVQECAVTVRTDSHTGQSVLVAYVAAASTTNIKISELRKSLTVSLPQYMVPQLFVELAELPRTKNGKVDVKALPEPAGSGSSQRELSPPETAAEKLLAQAWAEVLGLERISTRDNFFDLGGNSLLAVQVVHKIRESTGIGLNPLVLFSGTLSQTAEAIGEQQLLEGDSSTEVEPTGGFFARLVSKFTSYNRN